MLLQHATLMVRPRGWHLPENHILVDGKASSGALMDFAIYFFNSAQALVKSGSGELPECSLCCAHALQVLLHQSPRI